MRRKFDIDCIEDQNGIRLRLKGTLDGSSASELANFIDGIRSPKGGLLIDTRKLEKVFHFGTAVLKSRLIAGRFPLDRIVFAGEMAGKIAPRGCRILQEGCVCYGNCTNCTCGDAEKYPSGIEKTNLQ